MAQKDQPQKPSDQTPEQDKSTEAPPERAQEEASKGKPELVNRQREDIAARRARAMESQAASVSSMMLGRPELIEGEKVLVKGVSSSEQEAQGERRLTEEEQRRFWGGKIPNIEELARREIQDAHKGELYTPSEQELQQKMLEVLLRLLSERLKQNGEQAAQLGLPARDGQLAEKEQEKKLEAQARDELKADRKDPRYEPTPKELMEKLVQIVNRTAPEAKPLTESISSQGDAGAAKPYLMSASMGDTTGRIDPISDGSGTKAPEARSASQTDATAKQKPVESRDAAAGEGKRQPEATSPQAKQPEARQADKSAESGKPPEPAKPAEAVKKPAKVLDQEYLESQRPKFDVETIDNETGATVRMKDGKVAEVEYPNGKTLTFNWKGDELVSFKDTDGKTWTRQADGKTFASGDDIRTNVSVDKSGTLQFTDKNSAIHARTSDGRESMITPAGAITLKDAEGRIVSYQSAPKDAGGTGENFEFQYKDGKITGVKHIVPGQPPETWTTKDGKVFRSNTGHQGLVERNPDGSITFVDENTNKLTQIQRDGTAVVQPFREITPEPEKQPESKDKTPPVSDRPKQKPEATPPVNPEEVLAAVKAIDKAKPGKIFGGADKEAIFAVLRSKNESERQAINQMYKAVHGKDLETQFKEWFKGDDAGMRRAVDLLKRQDKDVSSREHIDVIESLQGLKAYPKSPALEQSLRDMLGTMSSKELAELQASYLKDTGRSLHRDLAEAKENGKLSNETYQSLLIYLGGGVEKRSAQQIKDLAAIALESPDKEKGLLLFKEAFRGDSEVARAAREDFLKSYENQKKIEAYFGKGSQAHTHALDYLRYGKLDAATLIKDNTGTLMDNDQAIESTLRYMLPEEREMYKLGKKIEESPRTYKPLTDQEKKAVEYYHKLHDALKNAAGKPHIERSDKAQMLRWEDLILNDGEETLVGKIAQHMAAFPSLDRVLGEINSMDEATRNRLKTDPIFKRQVEDAIASVFPPKDRALGERALSRLYQIMNLGSLEEAQKYAERPFLVKFNDMPKTPANVIDSIRKMRPDDQRAYQSDKKFKETVDERVKNGLPEGSPERATALRLLDKIKSGKAPELDIVDKINYAAAAQKAPAEILRDLQKELKDNPKLRDDIKKHYNNGQYTNADVQALDLALKSALGTKYETLGKPLMTTGSLPLEALREANTSYSVTAVADGRITRVDVKGFLQDLAYVSPTERDAILARKDDEDYMAKLFDGLTDEQRALAIQTLENKGQLQLVDKLRAHVLNVGPEYPELKRELEKLTPQQREALKSEYSQRYKSDLTTDLLASEKVKDSKFEKGDVTRLLGEQPQSARERYVEALKVYYQSIGVGSELTKLLDGTAYLADESKLALRDAMAAAIRKFEALPKEEQEKLAAAGDRYRALPEAERERLFANLANSLKDLKDSKTQVADLLYNGTLAAVAFAAAPVTGGVSLGALIATSAAVGATTKVLVRGAVLGGDYSASDGLKDGITGALELTTALGGGAVKQLVQAAAKNAGRTAAKLAAEELAGIAAREGLKQKALQDGLAKLLQEAVESGSGEISEQAVKQLAKSVLKDGASKAALESTEAAIKKSLERGIAEQSGKILKTAEAAIEAADEAISAQSGEIAGKIVDWDPTKSPDQQVAEIVVGAVAGAITETVAGVVTEGVTGAALDKTAEAARKRLGKGGTTDGTTGGTSTGTRPDGSNTASGQTMDRAGSTTERPAPTPPPTDRPPDTRTGPSDSPLGTTTTRPTDTQGQGDTPPSRERTAVPAKKAQEKTQTAALPEEVPAAAQGDPATLAASPREQAVKDIREAPLVGDLKAPPMGEGGGSGLARRDGVIRKPDGTEQKVVFRDIDPNAPGKSEARLRNELAAQEANKIIGFDNGFPATARRTVVDANGNPMPGWIQDKSGVILQDKVRELAQMHGLDVRDPNLIARLMDKDPQFKKSLEEAIVERLIYGADDIKADNLVVVPRRTPDGRVEYVVQNIDLAEAFSDETRPRLTLHKVAEGVTGDIKKYFSGKTLDPEIRAKLESFVRQYDTPEGVARFAELTGLTREKAEALIARGRALAKGGEFPPVKTFTQELKEQLDPDVLKSLDDPREAVDAAPPVTSASKGDTQPLRASEIEGFEKTDAEVQPGKTKGKVAPDSEGSSGPGQRQTLEQRQSEQVASSTQAGELGDDTQQLSAPSPSEARPTSPTDATPAATRAGDAPTDTALARQATRVAGSTSEPLTALEKRKFEQLAKKFAETGSLDPLEISEFQSLTKRLRPNEQIDLDAAARLRFEPELHFVQKASFQPTEFKLGDMSRFEPVTKRTEQFSALTPDAQLRTYQNWQDFAANALTTVDREARVYKIMGRNTEIVVPEEYAKQLDEVRELRTRASKSLLENPREIPEILLAKLRLWRHPARDAILPEQVAALLDELPDASRVTKIQLYDGKSPNDLWQRLEKPGFTASAADASISTGLIRFFNTDFSDPRWARLTTNHEWSHLAENSQAMEAFVHAHQLERAGQYARDYAKHNEHENFAVHFGEELLNPDASNIQSLGEYAPLRAVALAEALKGELKRAESPVATDLLERLQREDYGLLPAAQTEIKQMLASGEVKVQKRALEYLASLEELDPKLKAEIADALKAEAKDVGSRSPFEQQLLKRLEHIEDEVLPRAQAELKQMLFPTDEFAQRHLRALRELDPDLAAQLIDADGVKEYLQKEALKYLQELNRLDPNVAAMLSDHRALTELASTSSSFIVAGDAVKLVQSSLRAYPEDLIAALRRISQNPAADFSVQSALAEIVSADARQLMLDLSHAKYGNSRMLWPGAVMTAMDKLDDRQALAVFEYGLRKTDPAQRDLLVREIVAHASEDLKPLLKQRAEAIINEPQALAAVKVAPPEPPHPEASLGKDSSTARSLKDGAEVRPAQGKPGFQAGDRIGVNEREFEVLAVDSATREVIVKVPGQESYAGVGKPVTIAELSSNYQEIEIGGVSYFKDSNGNIYRLVARGNGRQELWVRYDMQAIPISKIKSSR